jgi:hypothetical protein
VNNGREMKQIAHNKWSPRKEWLALAMYILVEEAILGCSRDDTILPHPCLGQ